MDDIQIIEADAMRVAARLQQYAAPFTGPFASIWCAGFQMALEFALAYPEDARFLTRTLRAAQDMPPDVEALRGETMDGLRAEVLGGAVA